jgi:hypothetical protein
MANEIENLNKKMSELTSTQKKVDELLKYVPDGKDKQRLLKMREENRGFFSKTILPAWNKLKSMASSAFSGSEGMGNFEHPLGVLPIVAWAGSAAAVALAGSVLTYVIGNVVTEQRILSDPAMQAAQKAMLLQKKGVFGQVSDLFSNVNKLALIAAAGFGVYMFLKLRKKTA